MSIYLIWILGSKLIRSNNQSRATLWVLETCLNVGLLPLRNHLDHCFVVFKHIQQSFLMRKSGRLREQGQHFPKHWSLLEIGGARESYHGKQQVSQVLLWFWVVFPRTKTIRSHKSKAKKPSNSQSGIQRDDFWFCWTVWNWCLLLTHPTYWNKCMTSRNA